MINLDTLKEQIKIAHEAVKDESDPYKIESFKIILKMLIKDCLIEQHTTTGTPSTGTPSTGTPSTGTPSTGTPSTGDISASIAELAAKCDLTIEQLEEVITIKNNEIEIIVSIPGNQAEQQVTASQCILITHEVVLKQDWVRTTDIKESLRKCGIQDKSGHLALHLQKQATIFRMRGKGIGAEYKLTSQGRTEAYNTIRKLAVGE